MFVESINMILESVQQGAAVQSERRVLEHHRREHHDHGDRSGHGAGPTATASADRGDRGGAVLEGRDGSGGARLGPDLGELPAAAVGEDALAEIRRRLQAERRAGGPAELAGCQEHLRRRRPGEREALRHLSPEGPYYGYYRSLATKLLRGGRANLFKTDQNAPDSTVTAAIVVPRPRDRGTPDKLSDEILLLREQVGDFGTLYYASHDWQNKQLAQRSMVLLAEKVMPKVNAAIGG